MHSQALPLSSPCKHDVVAILSTRGTAGVSLRVMRAAEVVSDLVCQSDVTDGRRDVFAVVEQSYDSRVEALR